MAINMVGPLTPGTSGPLPWRAPPPPPAGLPPGVVPGAAAFAPPPIAPGTMLPRQARPGDRPPMGVPAGLISRLPAYWQQIYRRPGWTPGGVPPGPVPAAVDTGETPVSPGAPLPGDLPTATPLASVDTTGWGFNQQAWANQLFPNPQNDLTGLAQAVLDPTAMTPVATTTPTVPRPPPRDVGLRRAPGQMWGPVDVRYVPGHMGVDENGNPVWNPPNWTGRPRYLGGAGALPPFPTQPPPPPVVPPGGIPPGGVPPWAEPILTGFL